MINYFNRALML